MTTALTVRLVNRRGLAFIEADDGTETRVRYDGKGTSWRCDTCGHAAEPCGHGLLILAAIGLDERQERRR